MNLPNETTHKPSATLGFTFAVGWRTFVLSILIGIAMSLIPIPESVASLYINLALQMIGIILVYWFAMHWVLQRGFGSTKIILMEHVDYQKLISKTQVDKNEL